MDVVTSLSHTGVEAEEPKPSVLGDLGAKPLHVIFPELFLVYTLL